VGDGAGHTPDDAAGCVLREDDATRGADDAGTGEPVRAHAGEYDAEDTSSADLDGGAEQDVNGGSAEVFRLVLIEAQAHVAGDFQMPVAAGDVDDAGLGVRIRSGFADTERAEAVEALGKESGKEARHVLHDEDGQRDHRSRRR